MRALFQFKSGRGIYLVACICIAIACLVSVTNSQAKILNDFSPFSSRSIIIEPNLFEIGDGKTDFRNKLKDSAALAEFYKARSYQALWMSNSNVYSKTERMIKAIEESWTHGLNPETYHYSAIYTLMKSANPQDKQMLDILLSNAFSRYAADLTGMRVSVKPYGMRESDWRQPLSSAASLALLNEDHKEMDDLLKALEPKGQTYRLMRKELMRLATTADTRHDELLPIEFSGILKPGYGHEIVPVLRRYFDLPEVKNNNWASYDDDLAAAIISFQRENGLTADGVIGPSTMAAINHGKNKKIEQLIVNLERLRWDDTSSRGSKYVVVNIPSSMLWAIKDDEVVLEMPVVVGKPERATNIFKTEITGMRFNPDWTVPPTIKKKDILPKLQEDPEFYTVVGMRMIVDTGNESFEIDPNTVDWNSISPSDLQSIRMVQTPGINNPLGYYRVIMPNPYNIYLHDTTRPELFKENYRALSSGCVRVREPKKLASFILEHKEGWDSERIDRALSSKRKMDVLIEGGIPVSLLYYTTWVNENGSIEYGPDIYGYDKKLLSDLQKIDGFAIPVHNKAGVSVSEAQSYQVNN
jgi:L,D-transpeptidase YcbB